MRVISQDGYYDMPYEQAVVACIDRMVVAYPLYDLGSSDYIQLASYSTEEKAIKAMEMCRKEYGKYYHVQGGVSALTGAVTQPGIFTYPKVFQFPKDEEVR